ncbi:DEAD/DEAH box helicase family protein [Sphingomonas sp. HF-S4]|uniref:DEAD/DEAH box helicase family protein n=1 Tax=Sphingomonas agrestis TaxID=3080540 RepID=A0ABU3Y871_9SPHN|nr:DEAD/DEAH box helicase family protein [Sphingomonas sp. HF-S4]MDV3457609.1 DEAD/DEAH box helicase family protein [Sphingomonas sp. HF-S4]
MELKDYQLRALDQLRFFLDKCRSSDFAAAYRATLARTEAGQRAEGDKAADYARGGYTPVEGLEAETPYCCIRLPTGGGKTLLAAHAVKVAATEWMDRARVPVLWLVPSGAILNQTVDALKQPRHPYRRALEDAFGAVAVFDVDERRQIRPRDLIDKTVVIVATMQTFRVQNTGDRNVYRTDENLEDHFREASPAEGLEVEEEGPRRGQIKLSFANLLYRQRPLVILDEAHNFMTGLAGAVKQRLRPSAIIELTATPANRSNVISAATAAELKAAEMIKMPIHLSQHGSWQQAVNAAVMNRAWLEEIGARDPGRIRPIALYQAQAATEGAEATVDKLKQHLIDVERVPETAIAVATGDQRELDGVNLFDPDCAIEHVITVQALKEGWDCSFAYVFCSVAGMRSAGAVEQLLGRVLRMPFAKRRASEELNRAYAHVSEKSFNDAANGLTDTLTHMGFDESEARKAIIQTQQDELALEGGDAGPLYALPPQAPVMRLNERPSIGDWSLEAQGAVRMAEDGAGGVVLTVKADAPEAVQREVAAAIEPISPGAVEAVERFILQAQAARSPAERGVRFEVPRLHLMIQGELDLAEPESFIELAGWDPNDDPAKAELPAFTFEEVAEGYAFDIDGDRIVYRQLVGAIELALDEDTHWDAAALARFLDQTTRKAHTAQPVHAEYCRRVVDRLIDGRGMALAALVRGKYALRRAVIARVQQLRDQAAAQGVQLFLNGLGEPQAPDLHAFRFQPYRYSPDGRYEGRFRPAKHFYAAMGKLNGFEEECARAIDALDAVETWVRNGVTAPDNYSIPVGGGNFFPDMVAKLRDGRLLVLEPKGRVDEGDLEKERVGRRFAEASGGRLLFAMIRQNDSQGRDAAAQIRAALS